MVIGIFLRNIKSYERTCFVPIVKNNKPYSFFIGENGVGKSSILEALDIYFNKRRDWNINKNNKNKDEVFIAPVHLLKKDNLKLKEKELNYLESINYTLLNWDIDNTNHMKSNEWTKSFYHFIKELNDLDNYYLFISPLHYEKKTAKLLFSFDKLIKDSIEDYNEDILKNLIDSIRNHYSYIYIPVETPVDEILRMETPEMQLLVKEDILKYTESVLNEKNIIDGKKNINIVDKINNKLEEFMVDINYTIKKIDDTYSYSAEGKSKKSLTAADIREQIFRAFFSIRSLNKNKKNIVQLSSGEKRKALIDIATAFLKQEKIREKNVILAIDEPETSMHMKKIFNQFKQLESLTINHDVQFLGTTHWYGFLPITDYGNLNHIYKEENLFEIRNFDFFNLFERNDNFPDDIEMKSFFELITSILTSIKSSEYNKWIICEGSDDKKYLEYYLKYNSKNQKLIVLPVSGCGNVRKIYNLLYASLSEKDKIKVKGKILCLVDTDLNITGLDNNISSDKDKIIFLRRLQLESNSTTLEKIGNSPNYYQTEVEDCLESKKFFNSIKEIFKNDLYEEVLDSYILNQDCNISRIKEHRGKKLLKFDDVKGKSKHVNMFENFILQLEEKNIKQKICREYTLTYNSTYIPNWIQEIINLLELEEIEIPNNDTNIANFNIELDDISLEEIDIPALDNLSLEINLPDLNNIALEEIDIPDLGNLHLEMNIPDLDNLSLEIDLPELDNLHLEKIDIDEELEELFFEKSEEYSKIIKILDMDKINVFDLDFVMKYIRENKFNIQLKKYLSKNLINLSKNNRIINVIVETKIQLNFTIIDLIKNMDYLTENPTIFYRMLIIVFNNKINIKDTDLNYIIRILNSKELQKNSANVNEFYFLIYAALKINNSEEIEKIFTNQLLINLINSIFTIIYFGYYNKYILIGYQLKNLVALSNSILNTKSFQPYINIYIHALKQYKVFDRLLELDKNKTFINKLSNYYHLEVKQDHTYNYLFNKIFNDFKIN